MAGRLGLITLYLLALGSRLALAEPARSTRTETSLGGYSEMIESGCYGRPVVYPAGARGVAIYLSSSIEKICRTILQIDPGADGRAEGVADGAESPREKTPTRETKVPALGETTESQRPLERLTSAPAMRLRSALMATDVQATGTSFHRNTILTEIGWELGLRLCLASRSRAHPLIPLSAPWIERERSLERRRARQARDFLESIIATAAPTRDEAKRLSSLLDGYGQDEDGGPYSLVGMGAVRDEVSPRFLAWATGHYDAASSASGKFSREWEPPCLDPAWYGDEGRGAAWASLDPTCPASTPETLVDSALALLEREASLVAALDLAVRREMSLLPAPPDASFGTCTKALYEADVRSLERIVSNVHQNLTEKTRKFAEAFSAALIERRTLDRMIEDIDRQKVEGYAARMRRLIQREDARRAVTK